MRLKEGGRAGAEGSGARARVGEEVNVIATRGRRESGGGAGYLV